MTDSELFEQLNSAIDHLNDEGWSADAEAVKLAMEIISVSRVGTGERGDRIVIDDPHNVKESGSDVVSVAGKAEVGQSFADVTKDMRFPAPRDGDPQMDE